MNKLMVAAVGIVCAAGHLYAEDETATESTQKVVLENGVTLNYIVVDGGILVGNTKAPLAAISTDVRGRLSIPDSIAGLPVTDIGAFAFHSCTNLTEVTLPASVTNIGESAFLDCEKLEAIGLPKGLVRIGKNAFRGCSSIQALTLPDSLRVLNDGAFAECKAIRSIVIPDGIDILGDPVDSIAKKTLYSYSDGIAEPGVAPYVVLSDQGVFEGCDTLETATIMDGVKELGPYAFRRCRNLSTVILPKSLKILREGVFSECLTLSDVTLPSNVRSIGNRVFFRCTGLRSIQMPSSVTNLCDYAFAGCTGLSLVEFMGDEPEVDGWNLFQGTPSTLVVSVKKNAFGWYDPITFGVLMT